MYRQYPRRAVSVVEFERPLIKLASALLSRRMRSILASVAHTTSRLLDLWSAGDGLSGDAMLTVRSRPSAVAVGLRPREAGARNGQAPPRSRKPPSSRGRLAWKARWHGSRAGTFQA